jgi:hypothetical protein
VYNATDRAITDVLLLPSGTGFLAGVEVAGKLQHTPIPRKLKILRSEDLTEWREMEVDYQGRPPCGPCCGPRAMGRCGWPRIRG